MRTITMDDLLKRFEPQIRIAVNSVLLESGRERDFNARESLTQDARILLATYAELMSGWGFGRLRKFYRIADNDEYQVSLLVTHQLKIDLGQISSRETVLGQSLDTLIDHDLEPQHFDNGDDMMQEAEYRRRYPLLARSVFDGETQQEIADSLKVHRNTVVTKMAQERRRFLSSQIKRDGHLKTDGDETIEELEEAYANLHNPRSSKPVRSDTVTREGHRKIIGGLWFQERCLSCNQDCNASSDSVKHMCYCCVILAGEAVNTNAEPN